ncbi:hypothetical protein BSNK01_13970 [Bacillaceae bacterium]
MGDASATGWEIAIEGKKVTISNPHKLMWPHLEISKLEYLRYLGEIAPALLPYTRDRLLTIVRYPDGVGGKHFFQKNAPDYTPSWVSTCRWGKVNYILLNDLPTLIWLGNQAALELHVSFHTAYDERPTELVFDLDPSVQGDFSHVAEIALQLRDVLGRLGLNSWSKTSGATGLQLYVPIERKYRFEETRRIARFIAEYMVETMPRQVTLERTVSKRGTRLYIDYLQHWRGKTLPAPYTARATEKATVSAPVTWEELAAGVHPEQFTIRNLAARLRKVGDLFSPLLDATQRQSLDEIFRFLEKRRGVEK